MAPTDILARQHYEFLKKFYECSDIKVELLVSSLPNKQKKEIVENAEKRKNDIFNSTLQAETYEVVKECEKAIIDIDNLIAKRTEKE
jgi:RecG-like helicase